MITKQQAVFAEGALTEREKALMALAVAHAVQCPYCIDAYTQASLEKMSNVEEMTEPFMLPAPSEAVPRSRTASRCATSPTNYRCKETGMSFS
jgi:AhpD family alkylhydroperoxidase